MNIKFFDKIKLLFSIYAEVFKLPNTKSKITTLINPLEAVRYYEFSYFLKFFLNIKNLHILSVSSPHLLAYILQKNNTIMAINLDAREQNNYSKNSNIHFRVEDATSLTFADESFDIVYSISVIEHIFEKYYDAIKEMIRVAKPGGYIFITCPVSPFQQEEWITKNYYQILDQKKEKIFFQYRFNEQTINHILEKINNCEILAKEIFWEKKKNEFNSLINKIIKSHSYPKALRIFTQAYLNIYYGFTLLNSSPTVSFSQSKTFGNIHIILKKVT